LYSTFSWLCIKLIQFSNAFLKPLLSKHLYSFIKSSMIGSSGSNSIRLSISYINFWCVKYCSP
jgi:hypothetical protein